MTGKPSNQLMVGILREACITLVTDHIEAVCLQKKWSIAKGSAHDISNQFIRALPDSHIAPFYDIAKHPNIFQRTKDLLKHHQIGRRIMWSLLKRLREVRMLIKDELGMEHSVQIFESEGGSKELFFRNNVKGGHGGIMLVLRSTTQDEFITGVNANSVRASTRKSTETHKNNLEGVVQALSKLGSPSSEEEQDTKERVTIRADQRRAKQTQGRLFNEKLG